MPNDFATARGIPGNGAPKPNAEAPEMVHSISRLQSLSVDVGAAIKELYGRLSPVLRPVPDNQSEAPNPPSTRVMATKYAGQVDGVCSDLYSFELMLRDIVHRLEL